MISGLLPLDTGGTLEYWERTENSIRFAVVDGPSRHEIHIATPHRQWVLVHMERAIACIGKECRIREKTDGSLMLADDRSVFLDIGPTKERECP